MEEPDISYKCEITLKTQDHEVREMVADMLEAWWRKVPQSFVGFEPRLVRQALKSEHNLVELPVIRIAKSAFAREDLQSEFRILFGKFSGIEVEVDGDKVL